MSLLELEVAGMKHAAGSPPLLGKAMVIFRYLFAVTWPVQLDLQQHAGFAQIESDLSTLHAP